jgi:hypothetical protein
MDPVLADAVEQLRSQRRLAVAVEDRTIRLLEPVTGDPGSAVLRLLGLAQAASPVGAAATAGPHRVAAGVWRSPDLYLARWTGGKRWVVGYRLIDGARPNDYVRMEGRIPSRLETGNWYDDEPEAVQEAFLDAGLLLEEPPFEVARPAARPSGQGSPPAAPPRTAPRPSRPSPAAVRRPAATRLCPECRMNKVPGQFVAGSDLCVDCR